MQALRPYLLNQDLHFNKISQVSHNVLSGSRHAGLDGFFLF